MTHQNHESELTGAGIGGLFSFISSVIYDTDFISHSLMAVWCAALGAVTGFFITKILKKYFNEKTSDQSS